MKTIEDLLNKSYDKKLEKLPYYKHRIHEIKQCLSTYGISSSYSDEFTFYQLEIIYESIKNKERFEDTYVHTYVEMQGFWQELDYHERAHQMNVDIDRMRKDLRYFPFGKDEIYMPMFDARMNRLYVHDIVMLELKQYHRYMKTFADLIQPHLYGILPYLYHFTSCEWISGSEASFLLYDPHIHRLYQIENQICTHRLCFDSTIEDSFDLALLKEIGDAWVQEDENTLCEILLESTLIEEKVKKKLIKLQKKWMKKK